MRNVEKIKMLEHENGRLRKMVEDRNREIEKYSGMAVDGLRELREAMDAYLIQMCLRFGFTEEVKGELYEHCMTLPRGNVAETLETWKLEMYAGETEDEVIVRAVKRG